jgi:glycosyltransferase involved in cell wall biosynthesis
MCPQEHARVTSLRRLALIGNSLPRRCGIATFTTDLQQVLASARPDLETAIVAMTDPGQAYDYPATVKFEIKDDSVEDYARAANFLNTGKFDVVCLQHEFGIFGGAAGGLINSLLSRLVVPVVTTLHTVLADPQPAQRSVLINIVKSSDKVVVMAEKGREMLQTVYGVSAGKIEVIPHGIPDAQLTEPDAAKARLGFSSKPVILTFGLLSPNKGIEVMIDAMPSILAKCPNAIYVVLGATHPTLVRHEGERYRESLLARAQALGIESHVLFLNQFVDRATLLEYISMCDVYVTPYLHEAQMTSGSLAYSFGMGKAVVSTPYWHARELLADGRGVLVPFGDAKTTASEIGSLLTDDGRREVMRRRAYASSRSMTWERTAHRYLANFERASSVHSLRVIPRKDTRTATPAPTPQIQLDHLLRMCDDTGLLQHAVYSVPDRSHGYCVDDNARALLVACALTASGEQSLPEALTARLAAFIQHAWNPDIGRFRNFMSFERRWLENSGSEDSHGRALWALGECAVSDGSASRRRWAERLFSDALPGVEHFSSPRAWAFTLLGLNAFHRVTRSSKAHRLRLILADRLMSILSGVGTDDWMWFEERLTYDNARLSQALIATGAALDVPAYSAAGLRTLRWLMSQQVSDTGVFRPVGSDSFRQARKPPRPFDQQPVEATATISAALEAWRVDGDAHWKDDATNAFAWFLGKNDLSIPLVDLETGSCCDGLHPNRVNENKGAESVVSYLLSLAEMRQLGRAEIERARPQQMQAPLV